MARPTAISGARSTPHCWNECVGERRKFVPFLSTIIWTNMGLRARSGSTPAPGIPVGTADSGSHNGPVRPRSRTRSSGLPKSASSSIKLSKRRRLPPRPTTNGAIAWPKPNGACSGRRRAVISIGARPGCPVATGIWTKPRPGCADEWAQDRILRTSRSQGRHPALNAKGVIHARPLASGQASEFKPGFGSKRAGPGGP